MLALKEMKTIAMLLFYLHLKQKSVWAAQNDELIFSNWQQQNRINTNMNTRGNHGLLKTKANTENHFSKMIKRTGCSFADSRRGRYRWGRGRPTGRHKVPENDFFKPLQYFSLVVEVKNNCDLVRHITFGPVKLLIRLLRSSYVLVITELCMVLFSLQNKIHFLLLHYDTNIT